MYIYYPSCNFSAASPATAKKVKAYFEKQMPVAGCCRVDKRESSPGDIALYICQACRETLEDKVKTQSMWEYLDALKDFNFPNLNGQKFYVQDCWRDRNHPEIHEAVRSLLKKMHAEVIEIEHNREKSIFCGNLHYETDDPRLKNYPNTPLYKLPEDLQTSLMQHYAAQFDPKIPVLCYCNRCYECLRMGGATAVHLLDIAFSEM